MGANGASALSPGSGDCPHEMPKFEVFHFGSRGDSREKLKFKMSTPSGQSWLCPAVGIQTSNPCEFCRTMTLPLVSSVHSRCQHTAYSEYATRNPTAFLLYMSCSFMRFQN